MVSQQSPFAVSVYDNSLILCSALPSYNIAAKSIAGLLQLVAGGTDHAYMQTVQISWYGSRRAFDGADYGVEEAVSINDLDSSAITQKLKELSAKGESMPK